MIWRSDDRGAAERQSKIIRSIDRYIEDHQITRSPDHQITRSPELTSSPDKITSSPDRQIIR